MLTKRQIPVEQTEFARKGAFAGDEAWHLLSQASEILVAKGKKVQIFHPKVDDKDAILAAALGRSGTLRAPTLRVGDRIFVGFGEGLYNEYLG